MSEKKKSAKFLPEYLKTDKNSKFLSSTIDQFLQTPELERIDGYVGSKLTPNFNALTDFYINDVLPLRKNYSLEPALIFKDKNSLITDAVSYDDLINELKTQGSNVSNLDKLFRSEFYSYDPLIDWDKLVNYNQYYWLTQGPDDILIDTENLDVDDEILGQESYTMDNGYELSNGMKIRFSNNTIQTEYHQKIYIVEGVGSSIKLIDFNLLNGYEAMNTVQNESFDSNNFDDFPFDSDRRLPINPEYITINRSSKDLNPWSRYNRWFHAEVIEITAIINNKIPVFPLDKRAKRPIIEFRPNLQLFNFGKTGIKNIDFIDTDTKNVFETVEGSYGYYVDGNILKQGDRVIFNADENNNVRGKIYKVTYTNDPSPILHLIEDVVPNDADCVSVNFGNKSAATTWHFDAITSKWKYSQQHNELNQPPVFDLFNNDGISYSNIYDTNNFLGNKIFGYDIGTGVNDDVLGFPLKYQNSIGVGSYLFKNYFMTDVITVVDNNVSSNISTSITLLKLNNDDGTYDLINVWKKAENYSMPVIEIQIPAESTNIIYTTCFDSPIDTNLTATLFVNNIKVDDYTVVATSSEVAIVTSATINANDLVLIKVLTDQAPNSNGFYETPAGLTNNPLNGLVADMTLSELADHVSTMVDNLVGYTGKNLRDFVDYSKYGKRLIVNSNPISFAKVFLGKKEHNVVDALRQAGNHYSQFKLNLLKHLLKVDEQLNPADALDAALNEINLVKDSRSPYYRSDMLGYGQDKTIRSFTISDTNIVEYPVGIEFDLQSLTFKSVLVYLNDTQLINGKDYTFNFIDGSVTILCAINVGDEILIHAYSNTLGCYIPPTPSKLGLYPKYVPEIFTDTTYLTPVSVILGHDGSIMRAYGDYRDDIILEYEKRVYNNIKVEYNKQLFDITAVFPGAFRETNFSQIDINNILSEDFTRWAGLNGINYSTNDTFDEGEPFTWNYKNSVDVVLEKEVSGTWRSIYKYFYDTDRPHTHPWEMLGHSIKPTWWDDYYSWIPGSKRTALIQAVTMGYTQEPPSISIDPLYARSEFSSMIPVDNSGNLKSPDTFLVTGTSYFDKRANWNFGDQSPAETAWRRSSYWPFVVNILSALSNPCSYCSRLFDVSRTGINSIGQITYTTDDLYLDPRKLVIDGEDNIQTSGFGVYVVEKGKFKDTGYISKLREDLDYLDFNLFHKLGGFSSKEKLQISIDSVDPVSTSPGVVLPPEDYQLILNVSNPIKSVSVSGIIVQKANGKFVVKGYDVARPYFEILKPLKTAAGGAVTVGGVSEDFTEWSGVVNNGNAGLGAIELVSASANTTRYYKKGQLVRYGSRFYRVKTGHNAKETFDPDLFQQLGGLPIKGGASAQLPSGFEKTSTKISYGTEFETTQEVYDLIVGYGAWLESQGFVFDEFNSNLGQVIDWKFTGKEFLYWTTQNWANNNLITLSPFADSLKYQFTNSVVDDILSSKYEYSLLKADGKAFPSESFSLSREDGFCIIKTNNTEEGLFFATLNSIQKEHALVFNNSTIFNDTIYDSESGYKQRRIKLSGFRTRNWNGDLFSPGFVYDSVTITDWVSYQSYLPGDVVRYNGLYYQSLVRILGDETFDFEKWVKLADRPEQGLIPNFDYKISQFEDFYSLDIDNFDFNQQQLAQHLIGYTPRTYLNNIFTNPTSQYKFYQGFIKDKGTKNAIDKLSKASQSVDKGKIEFNEEWAFRVGNYGSFETYNELEFKLLESDSLENPYVVKFVNSIPTDKNLLINYITPSQCLLTPTDYVSSLTFATVEGTWDDNNLKLTHAGYVKLEDVTATAYNKDSLIDIANNSSIQNGNTFWLGFLENGDWSVYRYARRPAKISGVFVSSPGTEITFVTDSHHGLAIDDIVSIVNFNDQVNGVYVVKSVPKLNQFVVASELATIENEELLAYGILFRFDRVRFADFADLSNATDLINFAEGEKFWIDSGTDNKWQVFEKIDNLSVKYIESNDFVLGQQLGYNIFASDDTPVVMIASPSWTTSTNVFGYGRVKAYTRINNSFRRDFEHGINTNDVIYCSTSSVTEFGYSLAFDINKGLYFAGAPAASNIKATLTSGTVVISTGSEAAKSFVYEGLVKISSNNDQFDEETTEAVLVSPFAHTGTTAVHARFGHSIYVNQGSTTTSTLLLVGAPGDSSFASTGSVYAYLIDQTATVSILSHPLGIKLSTPINFSVGDLWGYNIAGNYSGSSVAISAPGYSGTDTTGVVLIYTGTNSTDIAYSDILFPEYENSGKFGNNVAISKSGKYLLITDPEFKSPTEPYGKVSVYKLNSESKYELWQTLANPLKYNDLKFGSSISINANEDILLIGSLGVNRSKFVEFDVGSEQGKTTFDKDTTKFTDAILDAGEVFVYNKLGEYFVPADKLSNEKVIEGSKFGTSVAATNNSLYIGAPSSANSNYPDDSRVFIFDKINTETSTWSVIEEQPELVDVSKFKRIALIDNRTEEITDYLDIVDPLKGKIVGQAAQELKYRSASDPAVYSVGRVGTVNEGNISWLDEHIGELWWDLSTAKYIWYEQGSEIFRKNNWGKLFPGATIDVYEWVKSDLLPSEWAAQADTNDGLTKGISGQPKYPDNSVISIKQVYNNVTNSFENVYYYWVKNKVVLPNLKNRRLSCYQVASLISDPIANGIKLVEVLSSDAIAFANVQPALSGDKISATISVDTIGNQIPRHTEWLLLSEGVETNVPNTLLEKKMIDSLIGHDSNGNLVPAVNLTSRNRYGLGIRPQQTLFKDRLSALRNIVTFVNSILIKNQITGNYSFDTLNKKEEIPDIESREYDYLVEDVDSISEINTVNFVRAELVCFVTNGKISSVEIVNPGRGYVNPPEVKIISEINSNAKILTSIDNNGSVIGVEIFNPGKDFAVAPVLKVREHSIIVQANVDYGNRWTKHSFNYLNNDWIKIRTQNYNVPLYWKKIDWISPDYNEFKVVRYTISDLYEISSLSEINLAEYVKVKNNGRGNYIILEKSNQGNFIPGYNIVYSEEGTIQILDSIWDYDFAKFAYDRATLEETLYDQIPDLELYYILQALKNDIFVGNLKVNWNLLFFAAVKYALTEQKLLDWAFKTSFINIKNVLGSLDQRPEYKLDNEEYFEEYIKEVKPYRTKIRNYTSNYTVFDEFKADISGTQITDFDLPSYFNSSTGKFTTVSLGDEKLQEYPWKDWADNYKYYVEKIEIADGGQGYSQRPTVTLTTAPGDTGSGATAEAYIRNGKIYKIVVTNSGSGYTKTPLITISGGGQTVTKPAAVSVVINNYGVRKNLVGMKFDRISKAAEINDVSVTDVFVCPGNKNSFTLSWLADHDKLKIIPKLNGKLVLSADYRIEYFTDEYAGYTKKFSRFVFLNQIPTENQIFKITYQKSIDLFNAIDRIDKYYEPTESMYGKSYPLLMSGLEYPQTSLQGLKFSDTPPWGTTGYDTAPWGNLVNNFVKAKLTNPLSISDFIIYVNTTTGITTGQSILVLTTSSFPVFRKDTFVSSIDPINNSVTITSPQYTLKHAQSTSTASGSVITFVTQDNFYGNIRQGDIVAVSGITTGGFNNQYTITTCTNNSFQVTAGSTLSNITATITVSSTVRVFSIINQVSSTATILDKVVETTTGTSTIVIPTYARFADVVTATVEMSTGTYTISISTSTDIPPRAIVTLGNLTSTEITTATVTLFGHTNLEFWNNNNDYYSLDSAISGGTWNTELSGALGIAPEDIIIDGDAFINPNSSYAPEEYVPGHTLDSVSINVYTQPEISYPTVLSGAIPITAGVPVDWPVFIEPDNAMSVMVYFNGRLLTRVPADFFNNDNQFYLSGNRIKMPAQPVSGRAYYTMVFAGSDSQMDSNYVLYNNTTASIATATVASSLALIDVKKVYVTVNGQEIQEYTGIAPGYILKPYSTNNKRAAVDVILPAEIKTFNIEAWFFKSPYVNFNKFHEETYTINSSTFWSSKELSYPPDGVEPFSSQVIVTVGDDVQRIRLRPPSVSYYKVRAGQVTFDIDNKNESSNVYDNSNVKVYVNGYTLRPGFDYLVNSAAETITIINNLVAKDDVVAVESLVDYDYIIQGNTIYFTNPITNTTLQIISFEDNQSMNIRTERFVKNPANEYILSLPVLNQNYVWVSAGSKFLIGGTEFEILADKRTIQISDLVEFDDEQEIIITTISPPSIGSQIIAYRIFKDIFERQHYKRLSKYFTTTLAQGLSYTDTEIYVTNGDSLAHPNPELNLPGVLWIDGERIEYFTKNGTRLSQLRRGTLGTAPAFYSQIGTKVFDQSIKQTIHTGEYKYEQHITTSSSTVIIADSTGSFALGIHTGQGIALSTATINGQPAPRAVDQVEVYYGGRKLRKTSLVVHDSDISYDNSPESLTTLDPEFYITTSTQELTLNIDEEITTGTRITVVQKKGAIWTTASLLTSGIEQAVFLRARPAELPDSYYYGGALELTDDNNAPLLDDDGNPLEGL